MKIRYLLLCLIVFNIFLLNINKIYAKNIDSQSSNLENIKNNDIGNLTNDKKLVLNFPKSQDILYNFSVNGIPTKEGIISWKFDGKNYKVKFFTNVIFLGDILLQSDGVLINNELTPIKYVNIRGKKKFITDFDLKNKKINFSKNNLYIAMPNDIKDFSSVAFQMIAIMRTTPPILNQKYMFNVTNDDEVQKWTIQYIGKENNKWHFVRLARDKNDNRKIEWWLDPQNGWLIDKFKQTEPNGLRLEFNKK